MAKVEGEYTAVNDLYGNKALGVKGLKVNGLVGRRVVLNGVIEYDHWYTTLKASDFSVGSSGGTVASLASISSYGTDVLGDRHNLEYDLSQEKIGANNTSYSKTYSIAVTQRGSGKSVSITATQAARKYSYTEYDTPSVSSVSIGTFAASGNETKYLTVYWTQSYRDYYDNGSYTSGTTSGSSTATITNGSVNNNSGAYISNGGIYCPSAGKNTFTSARTVYTISSYYFYANKEYGSGGTVYVSQSANPVTTSTGSLVLAISSNVSTFASSGGTATISYQSYKPYTNTWASGASESGETKISATLSTTYGTLGASSVSGIGSTTLTVGNDTGEGTTATIAIKAENTTKTVSITQAKRVESSTGYSTPSISNAYQNENIPAWGGTAYLMIAWSQTKTITYDNGTTSSSTVTGTSQAVITSGTVQQTGASLRSDGGIYKTSCGTEGTVQRTVYTVTSYYFTANDVKREVPSTTFNIGQAPNEENEPIWHDTYNITMSYSPTGNLSNAGGTKTISVDCTENGTITYTSTATAATTRDATASLTTTAGTLGTSSITGNGTSTLTVNENTGAQRTITVTATVGSTSKTISFVQNAVEWVFTATTKTFNVAYNATSQQISGTSSMNGSWAEIKKSDISVTGGELSGVVTNSGTTFYATITFDANTTNSPRTITVVVTQSRGNSSETITYTITQAAKPAETVWIKWLEDSGKWVGGAKFTFSATLLYNKSLYGKNATVNITPMKGGTAITSATSVTLTGTSMYGDMYVQDISLLVQTSDDGSAFSLRAVYGTTTADIELDESDDPLDI